ncbi:tetratricopeptide repeat-containing sensor histidine kinase [Cellulophaga sp. E16_2]|uniref:tetratricopeptide repeat-containing sensor histidine kinase n=1 Tax=Cellulophaga sp. E16_2 TaxID=2789297 RepID=UPI001A929C5F|nr:tetratricopeptide repeat-containing sensor histidine kinase [Cellulophaga sp. E16_2]MBO0592593.1 tetratricopeptide repeat-containing sensor histidine kinase [Cellulophaga sp. E16_2]
MKYKLNTLLFLIFIISLLSISSTHAQGKKQAILSEVKEYKLNHSSFEKDTVYINLINELAWELVYSNFDSVSSLSHKAIKLSKVINYKRGQAKAFIALAFSSTITSNQTDASYQQIDRAIKLSKEINADSTLLSAYNVKAMMQMHAGDHENAYKIYQEALEFSKSKKDLLSEIKLNTNLATLFLLLGDTKEAVPYYENSLKLSEALNKKLWIGIIKSNLGYLNVKNKNFDQALEFLDQSIVLFKEQEKQEWLSFAYITKGELYLEKKNPKEALKYFELSEESHKKLQDQIRKADLLSGKAKSYVQLQEYDIAEELALKGLKIAEKQKYQAGIAGLSEVLYILNKKKNNTALALSYLENFKMITDSTALKDKKNALLMLKVKTNFKLEQDELKKETNSALAQQKSYIVFSLFGVFIAGIISFCVYKNNKLIKKLNYQLKQKATTLEESKKKLTYANETQEKLFSIISHDLRSPINALMNLLLLIKNGDIQTDDFLNFVPKLYNDVDAMSFTLNNLLNWSKSQMNGFVNKPENFNLKTRVNDSIQLLQENANQKNIEVQNKIPEDAEIYCDRNQFNLIIRNLLNNSIKFTPIGGEIVLKATLKNNYWEIMIQDNGMGMSLEVKNKLFKPDSSLQSAYGTNKEKGTGLGLLLCKEMVENNGGAIGVETKEGEGATFYFTVPIAK